MKEELLDFLHCLINAQNSMLSVLQKKQDILVRPQKDVLETITAEETASVEAMRQILDKRERILESARLQNIGGSTIESLCGHFFSRNFEVQKMLEEAKHRTQEIRFLAYSNWTMSRKSIMHLTKILEMIETNGQGKTTYQPGDTPHRSMLDRVA
ncbi:MAG: flagellar protein FlgN [Planctomycetaceae bacterium]|nr:flagellar protein FlgN [Planctomycetaceae bacterium]